LFVLRTSTTLVLVPCERLLREVLGVASRIVNGDVDVRQGSNRVGWRPVMKDVAMTPHPLRG
jgi:hypothetical protein